MATPARGEMKGTAMNELKQETKPHPVKRFRNAASRQTSAAVRSTSQIWM